MPTTIRYRVRPVLAVALVPLAVLALALNSGSLAPPPTTVATGSTTTTTVPPSALVVSDDTGFAPPGHGCGFNETRAVTAPAPVGRCRVLEIGDSLGEDLADALPGRLPPSTGVILGTRTKVSTGLTNSWFFNWPKQLRYLVASFKPQLVIVFMGANDQHPIAVHGRSEPFGCAQWQRAYLARARAFSREATARGSYVVWVGLPIMQQHSYDNGVRLINRLLTTVARTTPGVSFVPTFSLFANTHGQYQGAAFVNGVAEPLRRSDGIHLQIAGDKVLATYLVHEIGELYRVQLKPVAPVVITAW